MDSRALFLASDAALRDVVDHLPEGALALSAPKEWTMRVADPTIRDILQAHAYDEAWVPDVIAGRTIAEVGDAHDGDLLGDDPVAAYDRLNDRATDAVRTSTSRPDETVHFQYGDYALEEGYLHLATYRAFQAKLIAHHVGLDWSLPHEVVDGMNELVVPHMDEWRQFGVFPPAQEPPAGADAETVLLCRAGFWPGE